MSKPQIDLDDVELIDVSWANTMETAPKDREILVFNMLTGWYKSKYDEKSETWPIYQWGPCEGEWYPIPECWSEIGE